MRVREGATANMRASEIQLSFLRDKRLAPLATSALPAWLWSVDATHILWTNPVGAAIFAADSPAAISAREFDPGEPTAGQIARLAATLVAGAPPRLERLRGFGASVGSALTCACSRIALAEGRPAILVVAAERTGGDLPLGERARRLLAEIDAPLAAFSEDGDLVAANDCGAAHLQDATSLAALGAQALAADALASGSAAGRAERGDVTLDRIGSGAATVLLVHFEAAAQGGVAIAEPAVESGAGERRHPLRFVWQMDESGRFTVNSDEFLTLIGPRAAAAIGRPWEEMAASLGLDPEGWVARALATRDTWSGLTVVWPVDDSAERLAVELSGLPVSDRDRMFRGYRGFGVCRDLARLTALTQMRHAPPTPVQDAPPDIAAAKAATPAAHAAAADAVPPSENVVVAFPHPAAPHASSPSHSAASAQAPTVPALSPIERSAFRELSRKLSQRLTAAGIEHDSAVTLPQPDDELEAAVFDAGVGTLPMLDKLPVGVLIYRLDHLLYANPVFLAWSGYESLGALIEAGGLDQLFIEPISVDAAASDRPLTLTIDRGDKISIASELIDMHWQGEPAHALVTAAPAPEREKLARAQIEIAELKTTLDTRNKTESELIEAKRQAEKASSAKSDFLARVSHEIRTPLNAIIGFSEVMMEERFGPIANERYRDYLKDIHASGGHLLSLINDLLDLSKIEAGKLELSFTGVALNELTQQCVAIMQPQAGRARVIIRTSLAPALPQVLADARSVRQIALNLLSNSIKFTAAGGQVIVSTALTDNGEVMLRVRDTGIGMSEQDLIAALEPFRQIATSARPGGTGLGLPLTKALAEANRASFRITSAPKEGTLVEIAFPASRVLTC
jgi:signal transduction histidine kinase